MNRSFNLISINKSFGANKILIDLNLQLSPGTITGIIGENGAGKSTLAGIINGSISGDSGEMLIDGVKTRYQDARAAIEEGVITLPQVPISFNELSIAENIIIGNPKYQSIYKGLAIDWKKALEDLSRELISLEMRDIDISRSPITLSGGQLKKINIARVNLHKRAIIILDEPFNSLDKKSKSWLADWILEERHLGKAILLISHDSSYIDKLADNLYELKKGRLESVLN